MATAISNSKTETPARVVDSLIVEFPWHWASNGPYVDADYHTHAQVLRQQFEESCLLRLNALC
jgi:hypothetical protein